MAPMKSVGFYSALLRLAWGTFYTTLAAAVVPVRVIKYEISAESDREKHFSNQHGGPLSIAS